MEFFSGTRMYAHLPVHVLLHTSIRTLIPINKRIHKHYHSYIQAVVFLKHFLSIANMIRVLVELVCTSVSLFCLFLNVFLLFCVKHTNQIGGIFFYIEQLTVVVICLITLYWTRLVSLVTHGQGGSHTISLLAPPEETVLTLEYATEGSGETLVHGTLVTLITWPRP